MAENKGTYVLTGANGGLGMAIAKGIAAATRDVPIHHAVHTVRSAKAAENLRSALATTTTPPNDILQLDLSRLSNVREVAASINQRVADGDIPRIRALILNAGYRDTVRQTWTDEGLDTAFATNYLGHWLLTLLLLQSMDQDHGRIVIVGGMVHDPQDQNNSINKAFEVEPWKKILPNASSESVERIVKGTWAASPEDSAQDPRQLYAIRRYGASKLLKVMMIPELQRRLDGDPSLKNISVLGVDPGLLPTTITVGTLNWFARSVVHALCYVCSFISPNGQFRLPHKSANDVTAAALRTNPPIGKQLKGLYLNGDVVKEISDEAKDVEKRASVWRMSLQHAQLEEGETCLVDWR